MQSRRGFLKTLMTGVSLAAFDPILKLWLPQTQKVVGVTLDAASGETLAQAVQKVTDEQLEMNDLALRIAKQLGERMADFKAIGLSQVDYQVVKHLQNVGPLIDVDGEARLFLPNQRVMESVPIGEASVDRLVRNLYFRAVESGTDVFAPITPELSPGSKFDDDMKIGIGVDPETGVSIRLLKWFQDSGAATYKTPIVLTDPMAPVQGAWRPGWSTQIVMPERTSRGKWFMGVETSGGRWETKQESQHRYADEREQEHQRTHRWDYNRAVYVKRTPEEQASFDEHGFDLD